MPASQRIEVEGVAKSLKILRSLDSELANDIRRQLKSSVRPVINQAQANLPSGRALTNWGSWINRESGRLLNYRSPQAKKGIVASQLTSSKKAKRGGYRPIAILELRNQSVSGAIFELAGAEKPNTVFNRNIERKYGPPKRVLYKAWEDRGDNVDQDVEDAVQRIEREITRKLAQP